VGAFLPNREWIGPKSSFSARGSLKIFHQRPNF
jgi:hypothetical protein